jgi:outer membrane immunogenic protein
MYRQLAATIATLGLAVGLSAPALAADLSPAPMYAKAPPVPMWSWTGCYLGGEGGGFFGRDHVVSNSGASAGTSVTTINPIGGVAGGTIGCNYQVSRFVFGIEDDISWNGVSASANDQPPFTTTFSHSVSSTWLDTLRGRAGFTIDTALLYVTGGAAFANIQDSATGAGVTASAATTATGWTAGGGVEWMFFPNWSAKVEYLFVQFPTMNDAFNTAAPAGTFTGVSTHLSENIVRAGINWHFTPDLH